MDQQLFHLINERWTNPALDLFMAAVSDADVWKPVLIIIIFAALVFGGFRALLGNLDRPQHMFAMRTNLTKTVHPSIRFGLNWSGS